MYKVSKTTSKLVKPLHSSRNKHIKVQQSGTESYKKAKKNFSGVNILKQIESLTGSNTRTQNIIVTEVFCFVVVSVHPLTIRAGNLDDESNLNSLEEVTLNSKLAEKNVSVMNGDFRFVTSLDGK